MTYTELLEQLDKLENKIEELEYHIKYLDEKYDKLLAQYHSALSTIIEQDDEIITLERYYFDRT